MDVQKVEEEKPEVQPEEVVEQLGENIMVSEETMKDKQHPFLLLPEEVRGEIYNKLPQSWMLPLRLVCQQWTDEIDRSYDYSLVFGERYKWPDEQRSLPWPKAVQEELNRRTERLLQFRVKECILLKNVKVEYPLLVLKYPKIMKTLEININDECHPDRCPLEHYDQLLKSCTKYLRKLTISSIPLRMLANDRPSYDLQALKTLKISHVSTNIGWDSVKMGPINQDAFFNNFIASNLKSLNITVISIIPYGFCSKGFTNGIIKLIGSCWKTLEHLNLYQQEDMQAEGGGYQPDSESTTVNRNLLQKVRGLKKVRLGVDWNYIQSGLRQLLENQEGLENVILKMSLYNPVAIRNNYRTLVSVEIEHYDYIDQRLGPNGLYDLSDFQNCRNLKQLTLSNWTGMVTNEPYPELVNFHLLPKSFETLKISQFLVSSNEIAAYFTDRNYCTNLETLLLACGRSTDGNGEFGVHYDGFAAILSAWKPNLKNLTISEFNIQNQLELDRLFSHLRGSPIPGCGMQCMRPLGPLISVQCCSFVLRVPHIPSQSFDFGNILM